MKVLLLSLHYGALILQWDVLITSSAAMMQKSPPANGNGSTCAAGYYYSSGQEEQEPSTCQPCTNCTALHQQELHPCNTTLDSACGSCLAGYFLSGSASGNGVTECQKCSRCPPEDEGTVVRWKDCQKAGLDREMWCSPPGYIEPVETEPETLDMPSSAVFPTTSSSDGGSYLGDEWFLEYPNGIDDPIPESSISSILIAGALCCLLLAALVCSFISFTLCFLRRRRRLHSVNVTYRQISTAPVRHSPQLDLKGVT